MKHPFIFDPDKAVETILYIANKVQGTDFHRISKLMYFADKIRLEESGRFICGDSYMAMKHGPVPCKTYDILKSIDFSYPVANIVLQHHERLDGSGYPNKLKADKILLEARILGVADVVEAMSSHRPYRPARGIDKALEEISQNKGIFYDPKVVDACLKLFKEKGFKFE